MNDLHPQDQEPFVIPDDGGTVDCCHSCGREFAPGAAAARKRADG